MILNLSEILNDEQEQQRMAMENFLCNTRVAIPGIIQNFNHVNQTATIQPAIKEQINGQWLQLPLLLDVPVQFPRAGGYCMTFPVKSGDECLVIFSDMCIDAWWQSGGIQVQLEKRRHDLSDAIVILGISSVPKLIKNFSNDTVQFRNDAGTAYVEINDDVVSIKAKKLIFDVSEKIESQTRIEYTE